MRRSYRSRLVSVLVASALGAFAAEPALAMHASGATGPWSLRTAGDGGFVSFGVSVGQFSGTASELVFDYPLGRKFKISELTWDLEDIAVAGVQASAGFGGRWRVDLGVWSAINEGSGMMVDRDWIYDDAETLSLDPGDDNWTHESLHPDTSVDAGTMFDLNLSVLALHSGPFSLRGIFGFKSDLWRWSARGGTYVYSVAEFRDSSGSFESGVQVIEYEQQYAIPYLGIGADWTTPTLSVDGHLLLSALVSASDSDYHNLRDTRFEGEFTGGTYVGLGVAATWAFAPRWFATLGVEYESVAGLTGDVTMSGPDGRWRFPDGGGVDMNAVLATLGAGYRF